VAIAACAACLVGAAAPARTAADARPRSWIVYWSDDPWPSIWAVRPDGSHRHRIIRTRRNAKRPRLSPDRAWVAFDGSPRGKPLMRDFDIQIVRLDGTGRRMLTTSTDFETDAQWSPDGQWLSYTRAPPNPIDCTGSSVWMIRRDGSDAHRVVDGCGARWAPGGARLVYSSRDGDLRIVDLKSGATRALPSTRVFEAPAAWSRDDTILFTRHYDERTAAVVTMTASGTRVTRLARGYAAGFSPNGRKILYTQFFFSPLYVMNRDGSHKRLLVPASAAEPDWR
jgi:Tol biopolymer transport system component